MDHDHSPVTSAVLGADARESLSDLFDPILLKHREGRFEVSDLEQVFIELPNVLLHEEYEGSQDTVYLRHLLTELEDMVKGCKLPSTVRSAVRRLVNHFVHHSLETLDPIPTPEINRLQAWNYNSGMSDAITHLLSPYTHKKES